MVKRASTIFLLSLLATWGFAKDKNKNLLPLYVLQAKTVAIVIDPNAGFSVDDPRANELAQEYVEAAFLKWGRFEPIPDARTADLIVMVRKGNSRLMDDAMPDPRQNSGIDPNNRDGSMGGPSRGPQPSMPGQPGRGSSQQSPGSGMGQAEDTFAVFKGGEKSLFATPVWRYGGNDGLNQTVPAVAAFKKAIAAADKAEAEAEKH
jgi:hypothetical protein